MQAPPSIWRVELWHPLVVHFPIALLLVGTVCRVPVVFFSASWKEKVRPGARVLLLVGTLTAWVATWTGTQAYYEVVRTLCDPTVADAHEYYAYWTGILFSVGVLLDALEWLTVRPFAISWIIKPLLILCLLAGSATLIYTGHQGMKLVYQQSAAVYQPTDQCSAFMDS